jgi:hypothetical protein
LVKIDQSSCAKAEKRRILEGSAEGEAVAKQADSQKKISNNLTGIKNPVYNLRLC